MKKADFQKIVKSLRTDLQAVNAQEYATYPKAMMTNAQEAKRTATVNCGGEWRPGQRSLDLALQLMASQTFLTFLAENGATAHLEEASAGSRTWTQVRINYEFTRYRAEPVKSRNYELLARRVRLLQAERDLLYDDDALSDEALAARVLPLEQEISQLICEMWPQRGRG